jgi:hypothetical protein
MKLLRTACFVAVSFALLRSVSAQGFVNLNFESANIPNGTSLGSSIPISEGMPGWSASFVSSSGSSNQATQVTYDGISLGGDVISIVDTNVGFGFNPIQRKYSAFLFGGGGTDDQLYSAQISQTGLVPIGTQSIQLEAQLFQGPSFIVTLGGQTISMSLLPSFSGFTYGGNIPSSLAGQLATLTITEPPPSGVPPSMLELDNISFSSSTVVPEPGPLALSALGGLLFGVQCCRKGFLAVFSGINP